MWARWPGSQYCNTITKKQKGTRHPPTAAPTTEQATLDHFLQQPLLKQNTHNPSSTNLKKTLKKEDNPDQNFNYINELTAKILNDGAIHKIAGWD